MLHLKEPVRALETKNSQILRIETTLQMTMLFLRAHNHCAITTDFLSASPALITWYTPGPQLSPNPYVREILEISTEARFRDWIDWQGWSSWSLFILYYCFKIYSFGSTESQLWQAGSFVAACGKLVPRLGIKYQIYLYQSSSVKMPSALLYLMGSGYTCGSKERKWK